jgi:hypothetical protein
VAGLTATTEANVAVGLFGPGVVSPVSPPLLLVVVLLLKLSLTSTSLTYNSLHTNSGSNIQNGFPLKSV